MYDYRFYFVLLLNMTLFSSGNPSEYPTMQSPAAAPGNSGGNEEATPKDASDGGNNSDGNIATRRLETAKSFSDRIEAILYKGCMFLVCILLWSDDEMT